MKKRILITGGSGFIGSHLCKLYLSRGYEVISILHDEAPITSSKLLGIHDDITWCKGDLLDETFAKRVVAHYEVEEIAHLAALPIVRVGTRTTIPIFQTNIMGTINILEAAKEQKLSGYKIRMLYLGTDKEYGYSPSQEPYTEETPLSGLNVYDASKACADLCCRCYFHSFHVPVTIVRACNTFGPADTNSRIIPNTIKRCLQGKPPIIFNGITYVREFIYVDDTCEAMALVLDDIEKTQGKAYNVGSGAWMDQEECVNRILKFFPEMKAERHEPPPYTRIEIPYQKLNTERIEKELGWKSKTSFEEGLKKTIQWYRENMSKIA